MGVSERPDGWFKSSYSNSAGGSCVEVRFDLDVISVRDSKDRRASQPTIGMPSEGWNSFLTTIVRG
jgi:uncharacterized protein DUF397